MANLFSKNQLEHDHANDAANDDSGYSEVNLSLGGREYQSSNQIYGFFPKNPDEFVTRFVTRTAASGDSTGPARLEAISSGCSTKCRFPL
jgi:hypothetical protein